MQAARPLEVLVTKEQSEVLLVGDPAEVAGEAM